MEVLVDLIWSENDCLVRFPATFLEVCTNRVSRKCFIIRIKAQDATIFIYSIRRTAALALSNADLPSNLT